MTNDNKKKLDSRVAAAIRSFWESRTRQNRSQGNVTGKRDTGNRAAATGGKQFDGFSGLVCELIAEAGVPRDSIFQTGRANVTLPGFFRPTKQWDVIVVAENHLLAAIELKSLCGPSFGNNYNNRIEEALGSASDIWTAYREGAFDESPQPFLGYLFLLEESESSIREVSVHEKHFAVCDEFRHASYATRCEWSLRKLVRERHYHAASLLLSPSTTGIQGDYREPAKDLAFAHFAKSLKEQIKANYAILQKQ